MNSTSTWGLTDANCEFALLRIFFLGLPFIYAIQVVVGFPAAGMIGYVPLILLLGRFGVQWWRYLRPLSGHSKWLWLAVGALVAHNAISGLSFLLGGNAGLGGRVLILFVLPFVVFVAGARLQREPQWGIVKVIALTAFMVALEMLWENICTWVLHESSWFQTRNHDYVLAQTGKSLTQLYLPAYRGTGLLEHVHASIFYVGIGIMAAVSVFFKTGNKCYLMAAALCEFVLFSHGIRFALLASTVAILINIGEIWRNRLLQDMARVKIALLVLLGTMLVVILADPFGTVWRFYTPVLAQGVWNIDQPASVTPSAILSHGLENAGQTVLARVKRGPMNAEFYVGLFGHGIANSLAGDVPGLDDDFFVAQIISQYGIIGGIIFYLIFVAAFFYYLDAMRRCRGEDGLLLSLAVSVVFLIGVSTLHSGVVQRKAIFPILLWALAVVYSLWRQSRDLVPEGGTPGPGIEQWGVGSGNRFGGV